LFECIVIKVILLIIFRKYAAHNFSKISHMQHEITQAGPLLNHDGSLAQKGWAKELLLSYKRNDIKGFPVQNQGMGLLLHPAKRLWHCTHCGG
jgi:hypothetical protein